MRIKVVGENDVARSVRGMLRQAGFAVSEFLPADAVVNGPQAGYVITIEETEGSGWIHLDSVDCPLERRVLQHITALSPQPVSIDRPGGEVHSERELRILLPKGDQAQATAVEFGVLRGFLELLGPSRSFGTAKMPEPPREPWYRRLFE